MANEVMNIEELGRYLKLAPVTLYKMVKQGKVPYRRIGKSIRFPKGVIDHWLNDRSGSAEVPSQIRGTVSQFTAKARGRLGNRVRDIRLYGSWARGEESLTSDIDLAVIVDRRDITVLKEVSRIAAEISLDCDRLLSVRVLGADDHKRGVREGYSLHVNIEREGIPL